MDMKAVYLYFQDSGNEKGIIAIFQVVEGQDEIQPGW